MSVIKGYVKAAAGCDTRAARALCRRRTRNRQSTNLAITRFGQRQRSASELHHRAPPHFRATAPLPA
ncbi:hypothetical protein EVAR_6487_1 [Eumeta japonica]|uniref:Uncharacterized protein n=1 Tax=Eumeta variegata TaxID=151549 RepID=A0A4C1SPU9_EUMVA|nr:hypothetical protein EVAR_6487_1 [Eumeta japonica]